jgi:RNA polymerase sigma-70 factor (ECF subfamily)
MTDQLALRIKLGDQQAFELLFRKYYVRLCTFSNKFLNDTEESRDVVQEVFAKIWEGRDEIDPEDSLKSYLFKITQNLSINKLRRKKVELRYTEIYKLVYIEYQEFSVHDSLIAKELEEHIAKTINMLPAKCRQIFELSRNKGLKYKEIANSLNISIKTVEAQMSKALQSLRDELPVYLSCILLIIIFSSLKG